MRMYTKKAKNFTDYANMRGVTDFTNAAQFNLYESGYSHLCVISRPRYIEKLTESGDTNLQEMLDTFCYILEYEFKGLDGIEDITVDNLEITDNISTLNTPGKVNKQSASEVTMTFTERSGSVITNFLRYYLEGIKDPRTQAKTYHGLIKYGLMAGGFENEVFNLLYIVTDNTMLQLEKAYLLCNAWPTAARTSIYNTEKGTIEKKDIEVSWQCFVIDGPDVDERALKVLAYINEQGAVKGAMAAYEDTNKTVVDNIGNIEADDRGKMVHLEYDGGQKLSSKGTNEGVSDNNGFKYNVFTSQDNIFDTYIGNETQQSV